METKTRPTISIKKHLNGLDKIATKKDGVNRLGDKYKFTTQTHFDIIDFMERVREKLNMNKAKFSIALGYSDSAYQQWCTGSRFSRTSYTKCMHGIHQLGIQKSQSAQQLTLPIDESKSMTDEQMALHLKSKGWKLQRPVTTITYEEI
jgi:DNA-binding transcriptional regulator YiaG